MAADVPAPGERVYIGYRDAEEGPTVLVEEEDGQRYGLHIIQWHSRTGIDWGYPGGKPADLALSLLADALGDVERALELHQAFMREVVAKWPRPLDQDGEQWRITRSEVLAWVAGRPTAAPPESHEAHK